MMTVEKVTEILKNAADKLDFTVYTPVDEDDTTDFFVGEKEKATEVYMLFENAADNIVYDLDQDYFVFEKILIYWG